MKSTLKFIKKEPILIIAVIIAIISCFFVPPSKEYIDYIDFKTLTSIFSLMIIVKGMSKINTFQIIAAKILPLTKSSRGLVTVLVMLPTFFTIIITNNVAILTFVPFALVVLDMCEVQHLALRTSVLITLGCNLGGLISPLGNSQNLYLFSYYNLPSTYLFHIAHVVCFIVGLALLLVCCMMTKKQPIAIFDKVDNEIKKGKLTIYILLMILVIASVIVKIKYFDLIAVGILIIIILFVDKSLFKSVNYSILITFVAFFICSGNIKNMDSLANALSKIIVGNEFFLLLGLSQIISYTPTVIIVSQFSNNVLPVVLGANLCKFGTIIASFSGIIVMRFYTSFENKPGRFLKTFMSLGFMFLFILGGIGYLFIRLLA